MDKKSGLNITVSKVCVTDILAQMTGGFYIDIELNAATAKKLEILLSAVNNISEIKYTGIRLENRLISGNSEGEVIEWLKFIEMPLEMGNIEWKGNAARN